MRPSARLAASGIGIARAVSVVGLALMWGVVWANLPWKEAWPSFDLKPVSADLPVVPELDLSIPGLPPPSASLAQPKTALRQSVGPPSDGAPVVQRPTTSRNQTARAVRESTCDAEVLAICPEPVRGEVQRRCVEERNERLTPACSQIQQRIVR